MIASIYFIVGALRAGGNYRIFITFRRSALKILKFCTGDILEMKKPHPCGANTMRVARVGSDMRVICTGCGRDLTLPREKLERAVKKILPAAGDAPAE